MSCLNLWFLFFRLGLVKMREPVGEVGFEALGSHHRCVRWPGRTKLGVSCGWWRRRPSSREVQRKPCWTDSSATTAPHMETTKVSSKPVNRSSQNEQTGQLLVPWMSSSPNSSVFQEPLCCCEERRPTASCWATATELTGWSTTLRAGWAMPSTIPLPRTLPVCCRTPRSKNMQSLQSHIQFLFFHNMKRITTLIEKAEDKKQLKVRDVIFSLIYHFYIGESLTHAPKNTLIKVYHQLFCFFFFCC